MVSSSFVPSAKMSVKVRCVEYSGLSLSVSSKFSKVISLVSLLMTARWQSVSSREKLSEKARGRSSSTCCCSSSVMPPVVVSDEVSVLGVSSASKPALAIVPRR